MEVSTCGTNGLVSLLTYAFISVDTRCILSTDHQRFTAFDVFHSSTGHTGQWGKASKQQLEGTFGTSKEDDVVGQILNKGVSKTGSGFASKTGNKNDKNLSQGSGEVRVSGFR
ncbi:SBDS domain-containing protein [Rhizoctonia solani AG-1 IA]|uniref:SBDS domain-containing protein n=1 Tax=Thanatephorus cucumeris (strain AG1-IA) TaxID=983506 RepID=L8X5P5_THACA|nr:SBDS domain-containing protein [Rhizoctonia solani AG-1 IA]